MRGSFWLAPVVLLLACGPAVAPSKLSQVERLVVVSDLVGSSPTYSSGFVTLLAKNDDAVFPFFAGKDFAAGAPKASLVRFDRAGEGFSELAAEDAVCRCAGSECPADTACLRSDSQASTAVVIQLGANDLLSIFFELYSSETLRADPQPALDRFRTSVRGVLALTSDRRLFPRPVWPLVANIADPSDGVGDVGTLVSAAFPLPAFDFTVVKPELANRVLADMNQIIAEEAATAEATLIDVHQHFLGHGYHSADTTNPSYVAADATRWFRSLIDPNRRGAHEIRRLVWRALTKEDIAQIPGDLPAELPNGLPAVPATGWANTVVDSKIAASITIPKFGTSPLRNGGADPTRATGAPDDWNEGAVAIGVLGNYLVLDMGEGEEITDGAGEDLVVLEMGRLSGGVPERYRVLVAATATGPFTPIAEGAGEQAFDLAGTGVSSARYVRIESLVRLADIENGLGSPFFPGPEINAVGAVHPANQ
jgi:hypothetical protein